MPKNTQFVPPALPPKKQRITSSNASLNVIITPPVSPKTSNDTAFNHSKSHEKNEVKADNHHVSESAGDNEPETVVLRKKPSEMVRLSKLRETSRSSFT